MTELKNSWLSHVARRAFGKGGEGLTAINRLTSMYPEILPDILSELEDIQDPDAAAYIYRQANENSQFVPMAFNSMARNVDSSSVRNMGLLAIKYPQYIPLLLDTLKDVKTDEVVHEFANIAVSNRNYAMVCMDGIKRVGTPVATRELIILAHHMAQFSEWKYARYALNTALDLRKDFEEDKSTKADLDGRIDGLRMKMAGVPATMQP